MSTWGDYLRRCEDEWRGIGGGDDGCFFDRRSPRLRKDLLSPRARADLAENTTQEGQDDGQADD